MSRRIVWLQLLIGWLPIWALFTTLIVYAHEDTTPVSAALISLRMIVAAALLGLAVQRMAERYRWPRPVRPGFVLFHLGAAIVYALAWVLLNSIIESVLHGAIMIVVGVGIGSFLLVGIWLYVMIAGVSYTLSSNERAIRAEAAAAEAQLSALRAQLNPHFLFNALHTVVQLIPREPLVAAQAAEQVAGLLRSTLEEDRDVISLAREMDFVKRYLDVEAIRFGERLRVHIDVPEHALTARIPSFAIQTLTENAVRHGAAPQVEPTDLTVRARIEGGELRVTVIDTGTGYYGAAADSGGTGLRRLRERLSVLYGAAAKAEIESKENGGAVASLVIPQGDDD